MQMNLVEDEGAAFDVRRTGGPSTSRRTRRRALR